VASPPRWKARGCVICGKMGRRCVMPPPSRLRFSVSVPSFSEPTTPDHLPIMPQTKEIQGFQRGKTVAWVASSCVAKRKLRHESANCDSPLRVCASLWRCRDITQKGLETLNPNRCPPLQKDSLPAPPCRMPAVPWQPGNRHPFSLQGRGVERVTLQPVASLVSKTRTG
jgi:hypothetical protein